MAAELRTSILINLVGNLQSQGQRWIDMLRGMGRTATDSGEKMEGALQRTGTLMGNLVHRYAGFALAGGFGAFALRIATAEEKLERLGVRLGKTTEQMHAFKKSASETAKAVGLETSTLMEAAASIEEATRDAGFVQKIQPLLAQMLQVAGPGKESEVVQFLTGLQRQGITSPEAVRRTVERTLAQAASKEGAMTSAQLLGTAGALPAAFLGTGHRGELAVLEAGALLQVAMKGSPGRGGAPSPEHAAMGVMSLIRDLLDHETQKKLAAGGISVYDAEAMRRGERVLRPIDEILFDIVKRAQGRADVLSRVVSEPSMGVLGPLAEEFKRTGDIGSLRRLLAPQGGNRIAEEADRIRELPSVQFRKAKDEMEKSAAKLIAKPMLNVERAGVQVFEGKFGELFSEMHVGSDFVRMIPGKEALEARREAEQARGRLYAPQGRVDIHISTEPGTKARVDRLEGDGLDVFTGPVGSP